MHLQQECNNIGKYEIIQTAYLLLHVGCPWDRESIDTAASKDTAASRWMFALFFRWQDHDSSGNDCSTCRNTCQVSQGSPQMPL